ncbi:MAG: TIGR01906 family membrane protein [Xylanivirga thermophila]|jgi:integral membrane protein (TIGR01906 family)|uniref:TIGR01906 family membrane protein n=1 Tax=Xylanivirga thermophila TaxID=2496273 RepID=UPI00101C4F90|nr:TIGR01906 family membrane protein [Xylanivirga thermophila]
MNVKIKYLLTSIIAMGLFMFVIFSIVLEVTAFDIDFYKYEYERLNIPQYTGMPLQDLVKVTRHLFSYINNNASSLQVKAVIHGKEQYVFNSREIAHMKDVKVLFNKGYTSRYIAFLLLLIMLLLLYLTTKGKTLLYLAKGYIIWLIIVIILLMVLFLFISEDFMSFWIQFHHMLFDNDLWLLDPDTDILVNMVPEEFFFDLTYKILKRFLIIEVSIGIACTLFLKKYRTV